MTTPRVSRKPAMARTPQPRSSLGGTLLGVFIGMIVGLGMAASVAYWLMKNNPALPMPTFSHEPRGAAPDPGKVAKADDKPRFDFYKILPGVEEPKVQSPRADRPPTQVKDPLADKAIDRAAPPSLQPPVIVKAAPPPDGADKAAKPADRFWLQAGSFTSAPDAENLRARLALAGWEASVQQGALADKSIRYRVRLGPYDNADELGRMKSELAKRGFDVAVIHY